MKNAEIKTNINIEGVILTPELILYLQQMQSSNNENTKATRECLSDIVCFIGKQLNEMEDDDKIYAAELICNLSNMRDGFKTLMKP